MPVSSETSISGPYTPNGVTTSFAFDFKAASASEVVATDGDGNVISTALYSVTLDDDEGGTLTFGTAPEASDYSEIYVLSEPELTQPSDFDNAGPSFNPAALTRAIDRAAIRDLKLHRDIGRALKLPFGEAAVTFPGVADRANKYLSFLPDGSLFMASGTGADSGLRGDLGLDTGGEFSGFRQPDDGARLRDLYEKAIESLWAADFVGYDPTGAEDSTDALAAALVASALRGKTLHINGTPRVVSTLTVPALARIVFDGAPGNFDGQPPASYLIKDAACVGPALLISGQAAEVIGGGVVAEAGNSGDNIQITGHSVSCINVYSEGAGQHNWRIGKDTSGSPNANRFRLIGCAGFGAVANGLHIADNLTPDGAPNANAGAILGCMFQGNDGYGIYGGNSFSVSVRDTLVQSNAGRGIYLDRQAQGWIISGGDAEHNEGGSGNVGADLYIADTDLACTFTDSGDLVTSAGHGFVNNNPVRFGRVNTTTGINTTTTYYVINAAANTFQVSATKGGAAVALTGDGTGIVYFLTTHSTRGGHIIDGLHVGRAPYDGGHQTDPRWELGQGHGAASGLRPAAGEGSWTPALAGTVFTGALSYSTQTGRWTKNGRRVTASFDIILNNAALPTCTFQDAGDTVTRAAHGLANGTRVRFTTITTTTGISVDTIYFVVNAATDTFQVATTAGGAALPLTTDGSGTYTTLLMGNLRLANLPFTGLSGDGGSISPSLISYLVTPSSRPGLGGAMNGLFFDLYGYGATDTTQFVAVSATGQRSNFLTAGRLSGTITYITAD